MKHKTTKFLMIGIVISLVHSLVSVRVEANMNEQVIRYENTTDFICGLSGDENQINMQNQVSIRFFNPHDYPVMLNNLLTLKDKKGFAVPELNERHVNVLLSPQRGFEIDCQNMQHLFFAEAVSDKERTKNFTGAIQSKHTSMLEIAMNFDMSPITEEYNSKELQ